MTDTMKDDFGRLIAALRLTDLKKIDLVKFGYVAGNEAAITYLLNEMDSEEVREKVARTLAIIRLRGMNSPEETMNEWAGKAWEYDMPKSETILSTIAAHVGGKQYGFR